MTAAPLWLIVRGEGFAVIDKPAGLPVEADGAECVVKLAARQLGPKGGRAWPRVVHRLDRGTSGCLVLALDKEAEAALEASFHAGKVEKRYLAVVRGAPPDQGKLDTAYGPDPADRRRHTTRVQTPRRARLSFVVEERFRKDGFEAARLLVDLQTGRTHQIRVQLAEAGFPVLGDATYGVAPADLPPPLRGLLDRPALHASILAFPAPRGGAQVAAEAPLPQDLVDLFAALRLP